tara:strand:- start:886 stop:1032 length:147 start_codon:yes stop_codon:yes gene_type:complete
MHPKLFHLHLLEDYRQAGTVIRIWMRVNDVVHDVGGEVIPDVRDETRT